MDAELFDALEKRVERLVQLYTELKQENETLRSENNMLVSERNGVKERIDAILVKLEGV
ncbi:MAG: cell division protein ZapB [Geobacter sp.]|nr:cell division protein ZapB [Geobacter sp.]